MQAIILAAGMGKRLKELTQNNTKCMVKVNGVTLIERLLRQLERKSLSRIVIVVGYQGQKLMDFIATLGIQTPIVYVENRVYDKTNNIYSLALAKEYLCREDTLLFESDLIFEESVIDALLEDPRDSLALVDKYEAWMDGTCVELGEDDSIESFVPGKQFDFHNTARYYKTVNVYKFSQDFSKNRYVPFLDAYCTVLGTNEYYEQVLRVLTILEKPGIFGKRLDGQLWYEIDDEQDLDIASSMFAADTDKLKMIQKRYGGYWRYPKLLDFCYLVNPYYPPAKLVDELKASFDTLLTEYPSGMEVNSLLAAKNFGVHKENILVGNGAAELIKALMEILDGRTGFIRPTFEEYPNRCAKENSVYFYPSNDCYSYDEMELMNFFEDKQIDNLVVVNPDNPSGNYISKTGLLRMIDWSASKNIRLVIDESFVDFAEEDDSTLIDQKLLAANPHLFVMKSISKSYGVPGLRLGVLASGNQEIIAQMKKSVAIWNINSFGEYYLQIAEKYKKDYANALVQIKEERRRFASKLEKIPGLRVIPSQANYVMVELLGGTKAAELTEKLLVSYNILVKDLSAKLDGKQFLRLAVRNTQDNDLLIEALDREL